MPNFTFFFTTLLVLLGISQALVQRSPGKASPEILEIHRRVAKAARSQTEYVKSTSLDSNFYDTTIFSIETEPDALGQNGPNNEDLTVDAGIKVACNACYTRGNATASLFIDGDFNLTAIYDSVQESVQAPLDNITEWIDGIDVDLSEGEVDFPPLDIDFNIDLEGLPEYRLEFQFDELELFADLSTTFSAGLTYRLTLFSQGIYITLDEDLFLGFVFSVDLVLSLRNELQINHGFHIKLDDSVILKLAMFSDKVNDLVFNGGRFEFLPVEVETAGTVIRAVLQLSLRAGFAFETGYTGPTIEVGSLSSDYLKLTGGLETRVWANIADLSSELTVGDGEDCDYYVQNSFQFGVGIAAGAYIGWGDNIWGPTPNTEIPLWPTTFEKECLVKASLTSAVPAASTAAVEARAPQAEDEDMETTTLSRTMTYTAVQCEETGVVNCPASAEIRRTRTEVETLVTAVPDGSTATWPESITAVSVDTRSFGDGAVSINTYTGEPEADGDEDDGKTGGVSNDVIIGVSVGVGVPVIVAIAAGIFFWKRKAVKSVE